MGERTSTEPGWSRKTDSANAKRLFPARNLASCSRKTKPAPGGYLTFNADDNFAEPGITFDQAR